VCIAFAGDGERLARHGHVELTLAPILRGKLRIGWIKIDPAIFLNPFADGQGRGRLHGGQTRQSDGLCTNVAEAGLEKYARHSPHLAAPEHEVELLRFKMNRRGGHRRLAIGRRLAGVDGRLRRAHG